MAVRRPVYWDGTNIRECSDAMITQYKNQMKYLYGLNPSVQLSVVASAGNLGTISDTRLQAGTYLTSTTAYPTEASTSEPSVVTVNYAKINQAYSTVTSPVDTNNVAYPAYSDNGNIRAFTQTDFYDTFVYPVIDELTNGTDQSGTYRIHTATTLTGHTLISATPVFIDTRANTAAYTAAGIPEAQDQPVTITNFYLFRTNATGFQSYTAPLQVRTDGNLQTYSTGNFDALLEDTVRYVAANTTGSKISYNLNGAGNNRGSGMTNTQLTGGSGNYQILFVNTDDYRAQEFPDGTATTIATNYLKITQV